MSTPRAPLVDLSFDDIDVDAFYNLINEQNALAIKPTNIATAQVQQPRLFQPAPSASTVDGLSTKSVVSDAKFILRLLANRSQLMKEKSDCAQGTWGSSDEQNQLYEDTHTIKVTLAQSGMSKERFYAACELVDMALLKGPNPLFKIGILAKTLETFCMLGTEQFVIKATHTRQYLSQVSYNYKNIPAPVGRLPFDQAFSHLDIMVDQALKDWCICELCNQYLSRKFTSEEEKSVIFALLYDLEKCCQEFDKDFRFNCNLTNGLQLIIDKNSYEQAVKLLLKDNTINAQPNMRR